jgi:hypothetical protein
MIRGVAGGRCTTAMLLAPTDHFRSTGYDRTQSRIGTMPHVKESCSYRFEFASGIVIRAGLAMNARYKAASPLRGEGSRGLSVHKYPFAQQTGTRLRLLGYSEITLIVGSYRSTREYVSWRVVPIPYSSLIETNSPPSNGQYRFLFPLP